MDKSPISAAVNGKRDGFQLARIALAHGVAGHGGGCDLHAVSGDIKGFLCGKGDGMGRDRDRAKLRYQSSKDDMAQIDDDFLRGYGHADFDAFAKNRSIDPIAALFLGEQRAFYQCNKHQQAVDYIAAGSCDRSAYNAQPCAREGNGS